MQTFFWIFMMADNSTPKKSVNDFDSFDQEYLNAFPDLDTVKFAVEHCASTQACSDYQKVIVQTGIESKVNNLLIIVYHKKKQNMVYNFITEFLVTIAETS